MPRKSIEPMVLALEGAKAKAVRTLPWFISEGAWDDALLTRHWQEVDQYLDDTEGVLTLDGRDFLNQGRNRSASRGSTVGKSGSVRTVKPERPATAVPAWSGQGRQPTRTRVLAGETALEAVAQLAASLPADRWTRHTIKEGSKGPLVARFAALRVIAVRGPPARPRGLAGAAA